MSHRMDLEGDECGCNAAPYVLGALTDAEHEDFVAHLQACAVCREEVAALQTVASALPGAVPQMAAPAALKQRVLAEVRGGAPQRRTAALKLPARRTSGRDWLGALRPAAAALAVIALLAVALLSGGGSGRSTRVFAARVSTPGMRAVVRVSGGRAELSISGMPPTPLGRVYEVWIKRTGAALPTNTLFTVASDGAANVGVPGSIKGVKQLMVTSEPIGGSNVPTSAPSIVAKLG